MIFPIICDLVQASQILGGYFLSLEINGNTPIYSLI